MNKIFNIIIVVWLLILTIFISYYVNYDRKMQSLDLKLDEANINTHEAMIKVIINNSNRISNIENNEIKGENENKN